MVVGGKLRQYGACFLSRQRGGRLPRGEGSARSWLPCLGEACSPVSVTIRCAGTPAPVSLEAFVSERVPARSCKLCEFVLPRSSLFKDEEGGSDGKTRKERWALAYVCRMAFCSLREQRSLLTTYVQRATRPKRGRGRSSIEFQLPRLWGGRGHLRPAKISDSHCCVLNRGRHARLAYGRVLVRQGVARVMCLHPICPFRRRSACHHWWQVRWKV